MDNFRSELDEIEYFLRSDLYKDFIQLLEEQEQGLLDTLALFDTDDKTIRQCQGKLDGIRCAMSAFTTLQGIAELKEASVQN